MTLKEAVRKVESASGKNAIIWVRYQKPDCQSMSILGFEHWGECAKCPVIDYIEREVDVTSVSLTTLQPTASRKEVSHTIILDVDDVWMAMEGREYPRRKEFRLQ